MMIICILIFIAACAYATIEGYREALYFAAKYGPNGAIHVPDEHIVFATQRCIVFLVLTLSAHASLLNSAILFVSICALFPFFHDGQYYTTRHELYTGIYPLRWRDRSTSTTAKLSLSFPARLVCFLLAITGFTYVILFPTP